MSGEKPGYREAMDRVIKRSVDAGMPVDVAKRKAHESITRIDRRVDTGENQRRKS